MPSRTEIIRAANAEARLNLYNLVSLYERRVAATFSSLSDIVTRALERAEREGKIPPGAFNAIRDDIYDAVKLPKLQTGEVKGAVSAGMYKDIVTQVMRGVSQSADSALKAAILSLDAAGIARSATKIGSSFIGKDGQVRRFNAARKTFQRSVWRKVNSRVVDAVRSWRPGGVAFSERVWNITYETQRNLLGIVQNGIVQGKSAATLSREIRQFLVQPETLRGKALQDYRPGRGIYKSAYKNAMRLTRTEINRAYGMAMVEYVKSKDFLDGVVWRRGSLGPCDVCPNYADQFYTLEELPDFPAHPHCMCYLEPHIKGEPIEKADGGAASPDVENLDDAKTLKQIEAWGARRYPNTTFEFEGATVENARATMKQYDVVAKDYPQVANGLEYVGTYAKRAPEGSVSFDDAWAHASVRGSGNSMRAWIGLNPKYYGDKNFAMDVRLWGTNPYPAGSTYQGRKVGGKLWHPKGCDSIESIITHEFGHQVHNYYWLRSVSGAPRYFGPGGVVAADGFGDLSTTMQRILFRKKARSALSIYATTNGKESFAEGFAFLYHGKGRATKYVKEQKALLDLFKPENLTNIAKTPNDFTGDEYIAIMSKLRDMKKAVGWPGY